MFICDKFIKVPKFFLILIGFWPFEITKNRLYLKIYKIYSTFQLISYSYFVASIILNVIILTIKHDQIERLVSAIGVLIVVTETCIKMIILKFKKIPDLFKVVMQNEEQTLYNSNDSELKNCYMKEINYCRIITGYQFFATLLCCISFAAGAFLEYFQIEDLSIYYKDHFFMHDLWFPFQVQNHIKIVIALNLLMISQGILFNTATQTTLMSLIIYGATKLKNLQVQFKKFDKVAKENNEPILATVKKLIKEHQVLIEFINSINDRTKNAILVDYVLNSISLASFTIQLFQAKDITTFCIIFTIDVLVLSHIFILAWCSNEITLQGLKISDAIFASNWYGESKEVQKLLLLVILRSQRIIGIKAGPFFYMNTGAALKTVKVAYSYMSLVLQE